MMAEQLRGPFEKFVDWRQCAADMQREAFYVTNDFACTMSRFQEVR
jgi:hypothetical protein